MRSDFLSSWQGLDSRSAVWSRCARMDSALSFSAHLPWYVRCSALTCLLTARSHQRCHHARMPADHAHGPETPAASIYRALPAWGSQHGGGDVALCGASYRSDPALATKARAVVHKRLERSLFDADELVLRAIALGPLVAETSSREAKATLTKASACCPAGGFPCRASSCVVRMRGRTCCWDAKRCALQQAREQRPCSSADER